MRRVLIASAAVAIVSLTIAMPRSVVGQTQSVNKLLLSIQTLDILSVPVLNRQIGYVTYNAAVGNFTVANLANGANVITLPTTVVLQCYVKNLHATNTVTVIATPQGGASTTMQVVGPGGVFLFWQTATAGTYGVTALTLTASGANTPVEYFLGG